MSDDWKRDLRELLNERQSPMRFRAGALAIAVLGTWYTTSDGTLWTTGDLVTYAVMLWVAGMALFWSPGSH